MASTTASSCADSNQLLGVLARYDRLRIVMHDNPDPDAIATGWAVQFLIEKRLRKPVQLVGGGAIVRAENKRMVELLRPPIELITELDPAEGAGTILVDCGVGATNHLLTHGNIRPVAVIDHHVNGQTDPSIPFHDLRPDVAASATIAASYLHEQQIKPSVKLATALLYAIRTETCGGETHYSKLDREIVAWLGGDADLSLLADIASAPLSRDYFGDLAIAMQNTFFYDDAALCLLPRASGAEIVGEVADLLIRCEGIQRVFCGANVGADLLISVRTELDADNAAVLLQETLLGLGGGGGHAHRAGGKVAGVARGAKIREDLHEDLRSRWLTACKVDRRRGTRLVARREIVENL